MSKRHCKYCSKEIPVGRIKAMPNAYACVPCMESEENGGERPVGIMIFSHKTAPTLFVTNKEQARNINRADRRGYKKQGNKEWE